MCFGYSVYQIMHTYQSAAKRWGENKGGVIHTERHKNIIMDKAVDAHAGYQLYHGGKRVEGGDGAVGATAARIKR